MRNTAQAAERGVFGSPSFFVGPRIYLREGPRCAMSRRKSSARLRTIAYPAGLNNWAMDRERVRRYSRAARLAHGRIFGRRAERLATPANTSAEALHAFLSASLLPPQRRAVAFYRSPCRRVRPRRPTSGRLQELGRLHSGTGDSKVCYAMSKPTMSEPAKIKRDAIYFLINDWPGRKAKSEPEIVPGYEYKDSSTVTAEVGADKFEFFTKNEGTAGGAWVEQQADETRLVEAMRRGAEVVVIGTSKRGTDDA